MNKCNFRKHVKKLVEERTAYLKSENEKLKKEIIDFPTWYSGMQREKVEKAYNRYKEETKNKL